MIDSNPNNSYKTKKNLTGFYTEVNLEIVIRPLATSYENLVASVKFLVALATRKAQFQTL